MSKVNKASEQVDEIISRVGDKLLRIRTERRLSLQQLAAISDVSGPSIHKIERSGMVPTITTLLKLSNALGIPLSYFIEEDENPAEPVHFTKKDNRNTVYTPHKGLALEGITGPYRQFQAAAAIAHMAPGANSGRKLLQHPGEELVHVLSGEVCFSLGGEKYTLKPGDSLHFSGEMVHQWSNPSKKPAKLLWVALRNE